MNGSCNLCLMSGMFEEEGLYRSQGNNRLVKCYGCEICQILSMRVYPICHGEQRSFIE